MADFCKQCAEDLGFPRSDFEDPKLKPGLYHTNLCEGCGYIQTNGKVSLLIVFMLGIMFLWIVV